MFEGRWRIKGNFGQINSNRATMSVDEFYDHVKSLCRDFFEAGILLAECSVCCDTIATPQTADFSIFWNLYDKKVGRPKCEKLWEKLTVKEKHACLNYIPLYRQAQPDKQFRKNPETFLRNKSWNDEIIYHNADSQSTIQQQRIDKLADILRG